METKYDENLKQFPTIFNSTISMSVSLRKQKFIPKKENVCQLGISLL